MNAKKIAQLIQERNSYRREAIAERWLCSALLIASLITISTAYPIAAFVVLFVLLVSVFIGGLCYTASRADRDMGIE